MKVAEHLSRLSYQLRSRNISRLHQTACLFTRSIVCLCIRALLRLEFGCPAGVMQTEPLYGPPSRAFLADHLSVTILERGAPFRSTTSLHLCIWTRFLYKDRDRLDIKVSPIPSHGSLPKSTNLNPEIAEFRMNPMPSPQNFWPPLNPYEAAHLYSPNSTTFCNTTLLRTARPMANDGAITLGMRGTPH